MNPKLNWKISRRRQKVLVEASSIAKKIATAWIKLWLSTKLLPTLGQLHSVPCHPVFLLAKTRFRTGQEEWFAHGICGGCTAGPLKIGDYVASSFQKEYLLLGARLCPPSHQIPFWKLRRSHRTFVKKSLRGLNFAGTQISSKPPTFLAATLPEGYR